jgi:hypothetical protein
MAGEFILEFTGGNVILLLLLAFLLFYLDSMVLTLLPEVLILVIFAARPETMPIFLWAVLLLIMANVGDVLGNYTIYLLFKKWKWFHKRASAKLRKYVGFLVIKDEKLILLNRIAPALPMCGVFMSACNWNVKKSLFYVYIGGLIKMSIILFLFGFLDYLYPEDTAFWITLGSVGVFLVISFLLGRYERKKLLARAEKKGKEICGQDEG